MAKFKVAAVLSNHMVLQRDKNIRIFGEGEDGRKVAVTFQGTEYSGTVKGEKWTVMIPPQDAGTGYEMKVACGEETRTFRNIAVGEVWLAGGQSNMEYELQNCTGGDHMLKNDRNPNVRFYYTLKNANMDETFFELEERSGWSEFGPETAGCWSAAGYVFGKRLAARLGVTVGIIGCNWGGTSASSWMSEESLSEDKELSSYLEEYNLAVSGKPEEQQIKEYREYEEFQADWDLRYRAELEKNPAAEWDEIVEILGKNRWPGPMVCINPYRPAGLYHCMLRRIIPYTLRGFIYYQGESDEHKPGMYQKLLTRLIRQWREDWEDLTLPFLIVQLTMHRNRKDPDYKHWCLLREAQMNTYQTVKNTGIAVITDCGAFNDIHPKDKIPVGERLALQAGYHVYHNLPGKEAFGPIYHSYAVRENGIELFFEHAEDGFTVKGDGAGFELAGEDMNFIPVIPEMRASVIYLHSPEIPYPAAARYCWTNYGEVTVYGKNGLPLAPFRTYRD